MAEALVKTIKRDYVYLADLSDAETIRERAVTMAQIAGIYHAQKDLKEAIRTWEAALPLLEKVHDRRDLLIGRGMLAQLLWHRNEADDRDRAA